LAAPLASCRLYAILARDGRSAVVFRRGPTRQVLVLRWWLDDDRIEPGQWLKGRIYERRCDLSPNGDLLIYFAAKWETAMSTWTAISRTPFLSALALWPKGDAWGGGGVFESQNVIGLNHLEVTPAIVGKSKSSRAASEAATWHPLGAEANDEVAQNPIPNHIKVQRWSEHAGRGEDNPLQHHRVTRDGWVLVTKGEAGKHGDTPGYSWVLTSPELYERPAPDTSAGQPLILRRTLRAIGQRDGPWYVEDFDIRASDGTVLRHIADCSWADWHTDGGLLFALEGRLYRLAKQYAGDAVSNPLANAKLVADLAGLTFTSTIAPPSALNWV
jgi:hypothetical protein